MVVLLTTVMIYCYATNHDYHVIVVVAGCGKVCWVVGGRRFVGKLFHVSPTHSMQRKSQHFVNILKVMTFRVVN